VSEETPTGPRGPAIGFGAAALRFFGALLWGRYPEDAKARKRAAAGGAGAILFYLVIRMWNTTNTTVEEQRRDLRDATAVMLRSVVAVEAMTKELQLQRTTLLEKIPDAPPPTKRPELRPVVPRRKHFKPSPDIGGVKP
jgi:hypothetical protein